MNYLKYSEKSEKSLLITDLAAEPIVTGTWGVPTEGFTWLDDRQAYDGATGGEYQAVEHGPWLVMSGPIGKAVQLRPYGVLRSNSVLTEFVALATDNSQAKILDYANKRGWLGVPIGSKPRGMESPSGSDLIAGEPLSLWQRKVEELADLLGLVDRLQLLQEALVEKDRRYLGGRLYFWTDDPTAVTFGYGGTTLPGDAPPADREGWQYQQNHLAFRLGRDHSKDPATVTRAAIELVLRLALQGQFSPVVAAHSTVKFVPHNLLAALRYHLLLRLVGVQPSRRVCACGCGEEFTFRSRKKRFKDANHYARWRYSQRHAETRKEVLT